MKFQTQIPLESQKYDQIDYGSKVLLLGSCFSENIGEKFDYFKFQNSKNPFGILFHVLAIEKLITHAVNQKSYSEDDIFFENDLWQSFDAHSTLSSVSKDVILDQLNASIKETYQTLKEATHIIITLGTAWVYRHIETDSVVANCHKVTQRKFTKELLPIQSIEESLQAIIALIQSINVNVSFVFTVSPVRHIKDGFKENTLSKSHLISAVHQVVDLRKRIYYFPSYEIMMDELRDYRFYKDDMLHPNNVAINYIWKRFSDTWMASSTQPIMIDVDSVQKGLNHQPFNENTRAHQEFLKNLEEKKNSLSSEYQHIKF